MKKKRKWQNSEQTQRQPHQWAIEAEMVGAALEKVGLALRISLPPVGSRGPAHWMIEEDGERVLDFWPSTGRWRCPAFNRSGMVKSPVEIIAVAWDLAQENSGESS